MKKQNFNGGKNPVVHKILGCINKRVAFTYPAGERHKRGILVDRAVVRSNPGTRGVPYWDVIDLIEFPNERNPKWIRIGYYRVPKGRLQWGSQTTITESVETWKRVLRDAAKQKAWFRGLLLDVMDGLKR